MLHASGLRHIHGNATDHGSIYPALRLQTHFTGIGSIILLSRTRTLTTDAAQLELFQLKTQTLHPLISILQLTQRLLTIGLHWRINIHHVIMQNV